MRRKCADSSRTAVFDKRVCERLGPLHQPAALLVRKRAHDNQDKINKCPNPQAAYGDQLHYRGPNFAHIKSVRAEYTEN